jgi:hypothetical protein
MPHLCRLALTTIGWFETVEHALCAGDDWSACKCEAMLGPLLPVLPRHLQHFAIRKQITYQLPEGVHRSQAHWHPAWYRDQGLLFRV